VKPTKNEWAKQGESLNFSDLTECGTLAALRSHRTVAALRARVEKVSTSKSYLCPEAITSYVRAVGVNEPDVLRRLREETAPHPNAEMQISPEQGQFFQVLLGAIGARKTLEVGVFTGYSSIATALALPSHGRVVALDLSEGFTRAARRYWREAGLEHKIELRLGPAAQSMQALLEEGAEGTFDFAFIDADKTGYDGYYELALRLVRRGGVIALDNMLQRGEVIRQHVQDEDVVAIRNLNEKLHRDSRVLSVLLPFADGVTLALKL
jgi:caffeoyl-CoA O-methyltransferase